ncbi:hypothetical protein SSX86_020434 [Deinandra increscens subsp. villosa]|uniref:Cotton fiber protein n=1 Tax=Deinandra increscens subsp. villosa TaxID=3103831 RepID=A0AAP0GUN9_9ASTR
MKKGASLNFLKNIISQLSSITKSKSLAIKSKVESMKVRVIISSLLKSKKLPTLTLRSSSISHKIHALLLGGTTSLDDDNNQNVDNLQLVLHKAAKSLEDDDYVHDDDEDSKYPDLRHSLFDLDSSGDPDGSVIDLVKSSMENDGEDFSLEDEIDHVADLFIMKFHKKMRLQKLESFKRYQDMLERGS